MTRLIALICFVAAAHAQPLADAAGAMQRGDFAGAEQKLRSFVASQPGDPWGHSLLGLALDNQKKFDEANGAHGRAVELAPASADVLNNFGSHLWMTGAFGQAEQVFSQALAASPAAFNILYNLGVMASLAGHHERARDILGAALLQQANNVDVLYRLATSEEVLRDFDGALRHLAQAVKLNSKRADVRKLLALTAMEAGALEDAAVAWDRYLELAPGDDAARRERGFTAVKMGRLEQGIAVIEAYVAKHPDDAVGHFELGQGEKARNISRAKEAFDEALRLKPDFAAALAARGALHYQEGKPDKAIPDLESAVALWAKDAQTLDKLGQSYAAVDRPADAVRVLRSAAALAPSDSKIMLHLGRALADAGLAQEGQAVMERFKALGPEKKPNIPAGLVNYLSLTAEQRRADYQRRVEKAVRENPADALAWLEQLRFALDGGNVVLASEAARKILVLKPSQPMLMDAARYLFAVRQFVLATPLVRQAGATAEITLVKIADGLSRKQNVLPLVEQLPMERPDLRHVALELLLEAGKASDVLRFLGPTPTGRDSLLLRAVALHLSGQPGKAEELIEQLKRTSPEWHAVWAVHGLCQLSLKRHEAARLSLETAVRLGANGASVIDGLRRADAGLGIKKELGQGKRDAPPYLKAIR